jgi:hypothetical protein
MKKVIDKLKAGGRVRQNLIEYGFATVIIAVVVWFVVSKNMESTNHEVKAKVEETNNSVNQLQSKIDSVKAYQDILVDKTRQLELAQQQTMQLIETGNNLLVQNRRAIEKIRLENNEKITGAANYNYKQLDSFFSSRYQGH